MLSGCGSSDKPASAPVDPVMERHASAGHAALALERPEQAIAQYRDALARARERDDGAAVADFGFNLAVAQLRAAQPQAALATARGIKAEIAPRDTAPAAPLQLVEAMALYRTGRAAEADAVAARVEQALDRDVAARAAFLRGLIADDAGNTAGLRGALGRMTGAGGAEAAADTAELTARLALRDGDPARAREQAERAVALRRDLLDYRSLARCLALSAQAASRAGDSAAAAQLYLRAGRSAVAQGDKPAASRWLNQALGLSRDPELTQTARNFLAALKRPD